MNRLLVFVAVFIGGLAIGGAASWLILDQGDRPGDGRGASAPGEGGAPVRRESSVPVPSDSRGSAAIQARSFKEASHGMVEESGDFPTSGSGKISGRVKSDKGDLLAGVVIRADYQGDRDDGGSNEWRNGDGAPPDDDMQTRVRKFIESTERSRSMRREAVSGDNGEFTIDGLLDDRYSLQAYSKGWTIALEQRDLQWSARPGMFADFIASPVIIVPIDIRLADGSVPKRANLMIQANNTTSSEQWRPGRPDLRLGAGAYTLHATAGDKEEYRSESQSIALKEGGTPPSLSFKLTARTGIRGRVKVPKGYALDSLTIFALRYSGTAVPDEGSLRRGQNDWASPWNGFQFSFNDLAPGTWLLGAGSWESIFSTKSVEVTAGAIADAVIEIADAGASGLVVRVVGPDNAPVADANVRVDAASGQHDSSEAFTVRPKKDGAWVVAPKKDGAGEGSEWRINVHSARFGEKIVPLPGTMSGELRVEMAEPASLDVTVTGYAGSGLEGRLRVDVRPLTGSKEHPSRVYYSRGEATLGPDGRQTVKPLQPGRYRVELQYQRERWSNSPLERVDIDVAPGTNAVSVPVPAVYSLTVLAPGEGVDSNMSLQLIGSAGEERWNNAKLGPDGTGVFEGLVAGTYRLSLWAPKARRNRSMKVTVPAAGPVQFKEEAETSLLVKVLDTEGYLASAGFQAGDVITGADGAAFDGTRPATQVLNGLMMARKEIKLQVVRAGKATETTVDTEKFATATNHMRSLEPASR